MKISHVIDAIFTLNWFIRWFYAWSCFFLAIVTKAVEIRKRKMLNEFAFKGQQYDAFDVQVYNLRLDIHISVNVYDCIFVLNPEMSLFEIVDI